MNTLQISNILTKHRATGSFFIGIFPRDRLPLNPKYPSCIVLNTDPSTREGEHWLAIHYDQHGYAEFFDSFAKPPSYYNLEKYLLKTSRHWIYNETELQSFSPYCGHYCCLFLIFKCRNYKMSAFLDFFTNSQIKNDLIIHDLIKRGYFV